MSANIIKANSGLEPAAVVTVKRAVHDAQLEAAQILADAQAQSVAILEEAKQEREQILTSSREEGYKTGLSQWNQALMAAWEAADRYVAQQEPHVVSLAVHIAEKILDAEITLHPEAVLRIAQSALKSAPPQKQLVMRVNPEDEQRVREWATTLHATSPYSQFITVATDPSITRGGTVIVSDVGIIDARLETQLARFKEALVKDF
jgi:type III secretion system HrpE/YscL family protein